MPVFRDSFRNLVSAIDFGRYLAERAFAGKNARCLELIGPRQPTDRGGSPESHRTASQSGRDRVVNSDIRLNRNAERSEKKAKNWAEAGSSQPSRFCRRQGGQAPQIGNDSGHPSHRVPDRIGVGRSSLSKLARAYGHCTSSRSSCHRRPDVGQSANRVSKRRDRTKSPPDPATCLPGAMNEAKHFRKGRSAKLSIGNLSNTGTSVVAGT